MLLTALLALTAQKPFDLTVDNIMRGPSCWPATSQRSLVGRWQTADFNWKDPNEKAARNYFVNADGTGLAPDAGDDGADLIPSADGSLHAAIVGIASSFAALWAKKL